MEEHELQQPEENTEPEQEPEPLPPVSAIKTMTILRDGQLQDDHSTPTDRAEVSAYLYVVEGLSASTLASVQETVPVALPDDFYDRHRHDNLSQISWDLEDKKNAIFAKWTRSVLQDKEIWSRESRLRRNKTPFDIDDTNPVASQLDHERYDRISEPYRLYHPLFEYDDRAEVKEKNDESNRPDNTEADRVIDVVGRESLTQTAGGMRIRTDGVVNDVERAPVTPPAEIVFAVAAREAARRFKKARERDVLASPRRIIVHAANECISLYHEVLSGVLHCVILIDPPRQHRITRVRYNLIRGGNRDVSSETCSSLQGDDNYLERLLSMIRRTLPTAVDHESVPDILASAMLEVVLKDQAKFLAALSTALDEIELTMERGTEVSQNWRDYPPRWRNHLFYQMETMEYLRNVVNHEKALASAARRLEVMSHRVDGTYQVLMSAMSILESEKAIEQAEVVTRLTNLAFLFIPPTFVAGIFGMNINEFENELKWWMWLSITAGITAFAYFLRYRHLLMKTARQTPSTIRGLRWDMLSVRLRRGTQAMRSAGMTIDIAFFMLSGIFIIIGYFSNPTRESQLGVSTLIPALISLKGPFPVGRHPFLHLRKVESTITAIFFATAGIVLWAVITANDQNIAWDTKNGVVYGVIVIPAFLTRLRWLLSTNALLTGKRGPLDDRPLITGYSTQQNVIFRFCELLAYTALTIVIWRLCKSSLPMWANTTTIIGVGVCVTVASKTYHWIYRKWNKSNTDSGSHTLGSNVSRVGVNIGQLSVAASLIYTYSLLSYEKEIYWSLPVSLALGLYIIVRNLRVRMDWSVRYWS